MCACDVNRSRTPSPSQLITDLTADQSYFIYELELTLRRLGLECRSVGLEDFKVVLDDAVQALDELLLEEDELLSDDDLDVPLIDVSSCEDLPPLNPTLT